MKSVKSIKLALAGLALLATGATPVFAQLAPGRPVTIIVPFPAGGGTDILARELARSLGEELKTSIMIDNRGGAGGQIAARAVSRATPDGLTLLFVTSTFVTTAATRKALPYDVEKDFTTIAMLGRGPLLLVTSHPSGLASVKDILEHARAKPGALNFVSSGVGGILHLATELFMQKADIKMTHVPYSGGGPAVIDLVAGRAEVFVSTVPTILGQVQGKNVKLLAVTSAQRSPMFPDTPTLTEAGVPGLDLQTWWGIVGPAGMADPLVSYLNTAINAAAAAPNMRKRFEEEGANTFRGTPAEFAAAMKAEFESWRRVVEAGNLYTN